MPPRALVHRCSDPETVRRQLRAWFETVPGTRLLAAERAQLARVLPDLLGLHLVQVGWLGVEDLMRESRIAHRAVLDADHAVAGVNPGCYARPDALPIASDSVDAVILPHVLEFEEDPRHSLREAHRVLAGEGHLVVIGFNPLGVWGLWRAAHGRRGRPPWCGYFLSLLRLRDWLALLGFQVLEWRTFFPLPPLASERWLTLLRPLEALDGVLGAPLHGAHVVLARKRVVPLTPIRPLWEKRRDPVPGGLIEPTTRSLNGDGH
jgi:SAM-dependent methyltransferase